MIPWQPSTSHLKSSRCMLQSSRGLTAVAEEEGEGALILDPLVGAEGGVLGPPEVAEAAVVDLQ